MKKAFNFKKAGRYALSFTGYVLLTSTDGKYPPLSLPLLSANLFVGLNPFASFTLYVLPFLFSLSMFTIAAAAAGGMVTVVYYLIMNKLKRKPKIELALVLAIAVAPYIAIRDCHNITARAIIAAACVPLGFVFISAARVFLVKGLKYRLSTDEIVSASVLYVAAAYGAVNLSSEAIYEAFALYVVLLSASLLKGGVSSVYSLIASLPIFLYSRDVNKIAPLALYSLAAVCLAKNSRLAASLSALAVKVLLWRFSDAYIGYAEYENYFIIAPVALYLFMPESFMRKIRNEFALYRENNLGKYAVNRNRLGISGKLFEISAVFDEMIQSLEKLSEKTISEEQVEADLADELFVKACSGCENLSNCRSVMFPSDEELKKTMQIATAKGKLNLADLPKGFMTNCKYNDRIVEEADFLARENERELLRAESLKDGRDLVLSQTEGLSEAIKNMAADMSRTLELKSELADEINKNLLSVGIAALETLVFEGGSDKEISVLLPKKQIQKPLFLRAISETVGYKLIISDIFNLSEELSAVTLRRSPKFDAAFSVSQKTKNDKEKSGDTHSITKINEGKFLVALNDGMGSGEKASVTSSAAVSLVETFYKAELSSETVLSTVNKVLCFNGEDNFTALDVGVIDLFSGSADFIKIGSPYSFIITKDSVKIVEGSSLPLGILDELHPTVCKTNLSSGDVVVLVSDGISDAFGSSSELIDFLSSQRALNPKTLADNILSRALSLTDGEAKDDMTAFCVRIFDRTA